MAGTVSPDSEIWRIISERVDAKRSTGIVVRVIDPGGRTQVFGYGDPGSGTVSPRCRQCFRDRLDH